MESFVQFGGCRINVDAAPTNKKDFVKMFIGKVPDIELAFKKISQEKKKLNKKQKGGE